MKHIHMMSALKPAKAEEVAWIQLKDLIGLTAITPQQSEWLSLQLDNYLQK